MFCCVHAYSVTIQQRKIFPFRKLNILYILICYLNYGLASPSRHERTSDVCKKLLEMKYWNSHAFLIKSPFISRDKMGIDILKVTNFTLSSKFV